MSIQYDDRMDRLHRPIPHDPNDTTVLDTAEHPQLNFHRRILAVQALMVNERGFPFDMIRRSAEEFDAQHAAGALPASAPQMLRERLPHYFEPSSQMGAVDGTAINDHVSFTDKLPKIYWRGDLSGSRWMTPYAADSVYEAKDLEDLRRISEHFSRPKAVYYSLANPDFTDFRFAGEDCKGIAGIEQAGLMTDKVAPTEFLKYRYVLCPNGNDVPTNLYWVIKSNSVAFREDCDFECVPDFFLKPWVHYVPVSKGLGDLKEKFSYCEANLDVCERIIEQANMAYLQLIDENAWEEAENIVLDKLGMT